LDYYKYNKVIPRIHVSNVEDTLENYYIKKLKYYYNNIKKQLNMTIEITKSSVSSMDSSATI
jgi:hypothetical protein